MPDGSSAPATAHTDNLALWNKLKRTDPRATKPFKRSGFSGTQIDPVWRYQHMTETFGPIGKGWGYEQTDLRITDGLVFVCVRCWWRDRETGDICWTGPQWGGDTLFKSRKEGPPAPNDEALKMAMTDAIGKALVTLGVAADIYLGQFDDSKYREEAAAYHEAKGDPDTQPAAVAAFEAAVGEALTHIIDLHALDDLWKEGSQRLKIPRVADRLRKIGAVDAAARQRIIDLFSKRKAEITAAEELQKPAKQAAPRQTAAPARSLPLLRGDGRNKDDRAEFANAMRVMFRDCTGADELLDKWNRCRTSLETLSKVERSLATALWTDMKNRERDLVDAALDAGPPDEPPPPAGEADYGPSSFT